MTFLAYELVGKRVELLKEAVPGVSRVAVLANPAHPGEQRELRETQTTARSLGATLQYLQVRDTADFHKAFDAMIKEKANGLLVFPDALPMLIGSRLLRLRRSNVFQAWSDGMSMWRLEVFWPTGPTAMSQ
jgi:putative ABC transport system substrate-binding protein